jgi:hypothetical protein
MNIIENIRSKIPASKEALAPHEVARLEAKLQGTFVSISPRKDFVERLNRQLITSAPLTRKQPAPLHIQDQKTRENLLIGAATLLGAAAIFATGFRVAVTLLGAAGILVQWLSRKSADEHTPMQPVS